MSFTRLESVIRSLPQQHDAGHDQGRSGSRRRSADDILVVFQPRRATATRSHNLTDFLTDLLRALLRRTASRKSNSTETGQCDPTNNHHCCQHFMMRFCLRCRLFACGSVGGENSNRHQKAKSKCNYSFHRFFPPRVFARSQELTPHPLDSNAKSTGTVTSSPRPSPPSSSLLPSASLPRCARPHFFPPASSSRSGGPLVAPLSIPSFPSLPYQVF